MTTPAHAFHIPVMGTGFTVDTPIRVAHLGIDSVISIVDDWLLERMRRSYAAEYGLPFAPIPKNEPDGRARRITAYLDLVREIVDRKFADVLADPTRYRRLAPEPDAEPRCGSIDVNIMAKVDRVPEPGAVSEAVSALAGFARSTVEGGLVLSAGFNPRLYQALASFPEFQRDAIGRLRKRIILKVSDFRSAMIQGRFLAKKGLEVSEYRIESGLNCGGHTFYADGQLMPVILDEFRDKIAGLREELAAMVRAWYAAAGREFVDDGRPMGEVTVQGGIGTHGERERLRQTYGVTRTGWGSPFLLVPEATSVDATTRERLVAAGPDDLYLSKSSPLGVPFRNLRGSGSEQWHDGRFAAGKPGSPCPKGHLKSNTEFTEDPICTASTAYMTLKLAEIDASDLPEATKVRRRADVLAKQCLCDHLGNGTLIERGVMREGTAPQAICPGPNTAWFSGPYTLEEMVDHIYGRGRCLTPPNRPHVFAAELDLNLDHLEDLVGEADLEDPKRLAYFRDVVERMRIGITHLDRLAESEAFPDENLASLRTAVETGTRRLDRIDALVTNGATVGV